jgi:hypothetical protein
VTEPTEVCLAAGCVRPQAAGIRLCAPDERRAGEWLANLGTEYDALDPVPSLAAPTGGVTTGGALASQRSVGDLRVMALRDHRTRDGEPDPEHHGVLPVLAWWAAGVRESRGLDVPAEGVSIVSERRLLSVQLPWILEQDAAGLFFDHLRVLYGRLRAANDGPRPRVLRCRRIVDGVECGGTIDVAEGTARCRSCGHTVSGLALLRAEVAA